MTVGQRLCRVTRRDVASSDSLIATGAVQIINDWIVVDPTICAGKPVLRGTRIMVKNILGMVAGGYTLHQILQAYPELSQEMVQVALQYAATVIDEEKVLA